MTSPFSPLRNRDSSGDEVFLEESPPNTGVTLRVLVLFSAFWCHKSSAFRNFPGRPRLLNLGRFSLQPYRRKGQYSFGWPWANCIPVLFFITAWPPPRNLPGVGRSWGWFLFCVWICGKSLPGLVAGVPPVFQPARLEWPGVSALRRGPLSSFLPPLCLHSDGPSSFCPAFSFKKARLLDLPYVSAVVQSSLHYFHMPCLPRLGECLSGAPVCFPRRAWAAAFSASDSRCSVPGSSFRETGPVLPLLLLFFTSIPPPNPTAPAPIFRSSFPVSMVGVSAGCSFFFLLIALNGTSQLPCISSHSPMAAPKRCNVSAFVLFGNGR